MKVSLAKTNKFIRALGQIAEGFPISVAIRSDNKEPEKLISAGQTAMNERLRLLRDAVRFKFKLREMVHKANEEHGVNKVLAEIAEVKELQAIAIKVRVSLKDGYRLSTLQTFLDKRDYCDRQTKADPTKIFPIETVHISIWDDGLEASFEKGFLQTKKTLAALEEKRNTINFGNSIEIPDEIVEFLREHTTLL